MFILTGPVKRSPSQLHPPPPHNKQTNSSNYHQTCQYIRNHHTVKTHTKMTATMTLICWANHMFECFRHLKPSFMSHFTTSSHSTTFHFNSYIIFALKVNITISRSAITIYAAVNKSLQCTVLILPGLLSQQVFQIR
jgi:hypothetical protein